MSSDEIVKQMQQILATMQRIVQASGELAERVDGLEQQSGEKLGILTSLEGNLRVLLESYQQQSAAQKELNEALEEALARLEKRVAALESSGA
jgi:chromosome segregation ATPase